MLLNSKNLPEQQTWYSYTLCDNSYHDPLENIEPNVLARTKHLTVDFGLTDLHIYGGKELDYNLFLRAMLLNWEALESLSILPFRNRGIWNIFGDSEKTSCASAVNTHDNVSGKLAHILTPWHKVPPIDIFPTTSGLLKQIPASIGRGLCRLRLANVQNAHISTIASTCPNLLELVTEGSNSVGPQLDINGLVALGHRLGRLQNLFVHTHPPGAEQHYINRKFLRLYRDGCCKTKPKAIATDSPHISRNDISLGGQGHVVSFRLRTLSIMNWSLNQLSISMILTFFPSLSYLHINPTILQKQTIRAELVPYPSLQVLKVESINQKKLQAVHRLLGIFTGLKLCSFTMVDLKPKSMDNLAKRFPSVQFDFNVPKGLI